MEKKFKTFDRVLVKDTDGKWQIDLYAYWNEAYKIHHTMSYGGGLDIRDDEILPFDEYSHLLGTTDSHDEDVRLEDGEWCIFFDIFEIVKEGKHGVFGRFQKINGAWLFDSHNMNWSYAIRFKDFDPSNMEETKKHILCVKNGRIIKYKN